MNGDILFVCTGNTCRSPMAEAIFNALSKDMKAHSAGIAASAPSGAAENAKVAVREYGGNLDCHMSNQLTVEKLDEAGLVVTMTHSHKELLLQYVNDSKIMTLAEFAGEDGDIPDPYGGDIVLYKKTAEKIYDYIKKGILARCECIFAKDNDIVQIAQMEKEYFPDAWSENSIKTEADRQKVIVLKSNDTVYGYCIFMIAADEGEILRIAVDKNMRMGGMGKKILSSVVNEMKKNCCSCIFLEVRRSNEAAISLYKTMGFEEAGVRKGYYRDNGEDAKLFKLEIKER